MYNLVVVDAFNDYRRGDLIEDPAKVSEVLASEHVDKVRKVAKPETKPVEEIKE
jgi:hypothetical protein